MNIDARRKVESAAQMIAATVKEDVVVYQMPSGALESRPRNHPVPDRGQPIYTAHYCETDLLRVFR